MLVEMHALLNKGKDLIPEGRKFRGATRVDLLHKRIPGGADQMFRFGSRNWGQHRLVPEQLAYDYVWCWLDVDCEWRGIARIAAHVFQIRRVAV